MQTIPTEPGPRGGRRYVSSNVVRIIDVLQAVATDSLKAEHARLEEILRDSRRGLMPPEMDRLLALRCVLLGREMDSRSVK